jgi:hypothetical protein
VAGFLNKKNRLIDYKLSEHGRKQLSTGDLRFKYYTLSDRSIVYKSRFEDDLKVSDSELCFLPFETTSDPGLYYNPEYYLTNEVKYENIGRAVFGENVTYKTLAENISNAELIKTEKIYGQEIKNLNEFKFDLLEVPESFDFKNETFTRKYITVKFKEENIDNIKPVYHDLRFSNFLKYKKLSPVNMEAKVREKSPSLESNRLQYIFKALKSNNSINSQEEIDDSIIKAVDILEKDKNVFSLDYEFNQTYTSSDDLISFELHNVNDDTLNTLDKLTFVRLGSFYDKRKKTYKDVFLIGKFFEETNKEEEYNIENNTLYSNSIKDYKFINMFTLVVEK